MKTRSLVKKYFLAEASAVVRLLQKPPDAFTPEDFHALRVHIKKIKTVMALANEACSEFNMEKLIKPYQLLFDLAGKVRELQLLTTIVHQYPQEPTLESYIRQLQARLEAATQDFFALTDQRFLRKLKKHNKKIYTYLNAIHHANAKKYASMMRHEIEEIMAMPAPDNEQYHRLRKKLKRLNYLRKMSKAGKKKLPLPDTFEELLGQWHDYLLISHDLLNAAQNHKLKPVEVKALMALQKRISNLAARLIKKINAVKAQLSH